MKKNKFRLLFLVTCFFSCTLQAVANDTIVMNMRGNTWVFSHYIVATAGEQFKVIYGDGKQQTYTGTGVNQNIKYDYGTFIVNDMTCTIVALSENCKFTEFSPFLRTTSLDLSRCPSIVKLQASNVAQKALTNLNIQNCINLEELIYNYNPLYNLDIAHCKKLKKLHCVETKRSNLVLHDSVILEGSLLGHNHLTMTNLYAVNKQSTNLYVMFAHYYRLQTLPQIEVEIGEPIDFTSENVFDSIGTVYWGYRDGIPITENDIIFDENGILTFLYFGNYILYRTNYAIICTEGFAVQTPILVRSNTSDATLASLKVSDCGSNQLTLNPEYKWYINTYEVNVNYSTSQVCISATPSYSNATVSGNGTFPLEVGENIFTITVTAEDGITELEYTVTVTRALNTDASLLNLAVSEGELTPEFNSTVYDYTVDVAYNIYTINITATTNDPNASISGTGEKQLAIGENTFSITVIAQDCVTQLDYTVTVTRSVGILENSLAGIGIYPNPTTGELRVTSYELRVTKIEIINIAGKKLLSFESVTFPEANIDISHLEPGTYFVKVITEQGEVTKKVVKQ